MENENKVHPVESSEAGISQSEIIQQDKETKIKERTPGAVETTEEKVSSAQKVSEQSKQCKEKICAVWNKNKKAIIAVVVLIVLVALIEGGLKLKNYWKTSVDVGPEVAKQKIQTFIDSNAPEGTKVDIKDAVKEGVLYKVNLSINGQEVPLYVTQDGKKLIQQTIDLNQKPEDQTENKETSAKTEAEQKNDVPEVKVFVMSFCPYGTQIEKGILPVVDLLGGKIKFSLEFVDYAMHGDKEITENLRQYCIQKTQPGKLSAYLKCFLKKGEGTSEACLKTAGVNSAQVGACFTETDKQFSIKANAADKNKWSNGQFPPFDVNKDDVVKYDVQGSPALLVNGTTISSERDSASLLKAVCSGFANPPKECSQKLSSDSPSAGFGEGAAQGASTNASCGS